MPKKKSRKQDKAVRPAHRRRRVVLVVGVIIGLLTAGGVLARRAERQAASEEAIPPLAQVSPSSLSPGSPAKEFIYAGDKLIATKEPIAFADPSIQSNQYYADIVKIAEKEVTVGCGVNGLGQPLYCPGDSVTREQMAAFIMRALGVYNPPTPAAQRFADVPPSNPFYAYIEELAVRQITLGCGGGNYCPTATVPHEQMAAFMIRATGMHNPPQPPFQRFQDVLPSNPFYAFIEQMYVQEIWPGCSANLYCPTDPVRRDQMARILARAFDL